MRKACTLPRKLSLLGYKGGLLTRGQALWTSQEETVPSEGKCEQGSSGGGQVSFWIPPLGSSSHAHCVFWLVWWNEPGPGHSSRTLGPVSLFLGEPLDSSARRSCRAHSGSGGHRVCRGQQEHRGCRDWRCRVRWSCRMHWSWHRDCRAAWRKGMI